MKLNEVDYKDGRTVYIQSDYGTTYWGKVDCFNELKMVLDDDIFENLKDVDMEYHESADLYRGKTEELIISLI